MRDRGFGCSFKNRQQDADWDSGFLARGFWGMLGCSFVLIRETAKIMVQQKERINDLEFRVSRLEAAQNAGTAKGGKDKR